MKVRNKITGETRQANSDWLKLHKNYEEYVEEVEEVDPKVVLKAELKGLGASFKGNPSVDTLKKLIAEARG